jgi:hypothetical protein
MSSARSQKTGPITAMYDPYNTYNVATAHLNWPGRMDGYSCNHDQNPDWSRRPFDPICFRCSRSRPGSNLFVDGWWHDYLGQLCGWKIQRATPRRLQHRRCGRKIVWKDWERGLHGLVPAMYGQFILVLGSVSNIAQGGLRSLLQNTPVLPLLSTPYRYTVLVPQSSLS